MIDIRTATLDDISALCALRREALQISPEAFGSTLSEFDAQDNDALYRQRLGASQPGAENLVFMAFEGETAIGMMGLLRRNRDKIQHIAEIWGMYVNPAQRGKGIGRDLMQYGLDIARSLPGLDVVKLSVITDNPAARGLYQAIGFQEYGIEPCALKINATCYDMVYMRLPLFS